MHTSTCGYLKQSVERLRELVRVHLELEPLALQQMHVAEEASLERLQGVLTAAAGAERGARTRCRCVAELAAVVAVRARMARPERRERRGGRPGADGERFLVAVVVKAAHAAVRAGAGGHVVRMRAPMRVGVGMLPLLLRRLGGRLGRRRELQVGE